MEYTAAGAAIDRTEAVAEDDTVWVPLAHKAEPLGVLELTNPDPELRQSARALGLVLGSALVSSTRQSDMVETARGGGRLQLAATLQRAVLPSPYYVDKRLELSGRIEPAYDIAGDSFDYAVDHMAQVAVFDAVGHGLRAAILSALATAAYQVLPAAGGAAGAGLQADRRGRGHRGAVPRVRDRTALPDRPRRDGGDGSKCRPPAAPSLATGKR